MKRALPVRCKISGGQFPGEVCAEFGFGKECAQQTRVILAKSLVRDGHILLKILEETPEYYDVLVPGEMVFGARSLRINKKEANLPWVYQIK